MYEFCEDCNTSWSGCNCSPLPQWAKSYNKMGELVIGTQLFTKDPCRTGNARIVYVSTTLWKDKSGWEYMPLYHIQTDIGNEFRMIEREVHDSYNIGPYILDLANIPLINITKELEALKLAVRKYKDRGTIGAKFKMFEVLDSLNY